MQKKKTRDFSGIISYPLKPPLGANFTTEQISCKSMVHHEPWGTSRFIGSLPAVYRNCAFHICPRYPAHKCLMSMASLLILLSGNVSHCVPLCRVLAAATRILPHPLEVKPNLTALCETSCTQKHRLQIWLSLPNYMVNHGVENGAG